MASREVGEAREAYLDRKSEDEQGRILRNCEKNGPGSTDADWLIAESAQSAADRIEKAIGKLSSAEAAQNVADRIEEAVRKLSSADDVKHMFETLVTLMRERQAEPPPVVTTRASRLSPTLRRLVKLRERVRIAISRASSAYALGIIAVAAVALLSWFSGATVTEARMRYANTAVATLLTTPAGHAAWHLLEMNGDGLPTNLARCRPYVEHGRKAMTCELWAQSAGGVIRHDTPLNLAWESVNDLPTWPFLVIAISALAALTLRYDNAKKTVRLR